MVLEICCEERRHMAPSDNPYTIQESSGVRPVKTD